mgnify:FL=1
MLCREEEAKTRKEMKTIRAVLLLCAVAVVGLGFQAGKLNTALLFAGLLAYLAVLLSVKVRKQRPT